MALDQCRDRFTGECILSDADTKALHMTFGRRAAAPLKLLCAHTPDCTLEADARTLHRIAAQLRDGKRDARAVLLQHQAVARQATKARAEVSGSCNVCRTRGRGLHMC